MKNPQFNIVRSFLKLFILFFPFLLTCYCKSFNKKLKKKKKKTILFSIKEERGKKIDEKSKNFSRIHEKGTTIVDNKRKKEIKTIVV